MISTRATICFGKLTLRGGFPAYPEKLLGLFDSLFAEVYLFQEVRLVAMNGGQVSGRGEGGLPSSNQIEAIEAPSG